MPIKFKNKDIKELGSWQRAFIPTYSERIRRARERTIKPMEICLERIQMEIKSYEQHKNEPRILQQARFLEAYLKEKTTTIFDGELIVGNITSKPRGAPVSMCNISILAEELDDPVKDFSIRPYDKMIIHPEERKLIREQIIPAAKGKEYSLYEYNKQTIPASVLAGASPANSECPHIPNVADASMSREAGHMFLNFEKVLNKGLKGIKEEVKYHMAELNLPYTHFGLKEKQDFYKAVIITLDVVMDYAKRYATLAREMASREPDCKRKEELERIASVCEWVPSNPARDWWEALQSVWLVFSIAWMEHSTSAVHFLSRFDQYMYPFYKKTVEEQREMTKEEALEILECFLLKFSEPAWILGYEWSSKATGQGLSQTLVIGGQTRQGKDACNEVSLLVLEAMKQLRLNQPEFAMRVWEGTPDKYLKKAAELIRLGLGYPKFIGDRKALQMLSKAYPDLSEEDWRGYAIAGCSEIGLPYISMDHGFEGIMIAPKVLELVINNGKCSLCGKQIGPATGEPSTFGSMDQVKEAFRKQVFYWGECMAIADKALKENQSRWYPAPFCSALSDGPLDKGKDITQGGAWYTLYGLLLAGLADTADSLGVIDKLIYQERKVSWEQLHKALEANWQGHEHLRQLCINGVPKYGNDKDYADDWAVWVVNVWADLIDWLNTRNDFIPSWGGKYLGGGLVAVASTQFGELVGATCNGREHPKPLADTCSPVQGCDRNGPTAVARSFSKLPTQRWALCGMINLRLSPELFMTEADLDGFVAFVRACEELGIYHVQFNVISSDLLRAAIAEPEKYKDLMVRVASYIAYFVELNPEQQMDIINRTEHQSW
jgi:formate C-acetyltransferase